MTTWISREAGVTLAARPLSDHARHWHQASWDPATMQWHWQPQAEAAL
jgi:hypothetical protein